MRKFSNTYRPTFTESMNLCSTSNHILDFLTKAFVSKPFYPLDVPVKSELCIC